MISKRNPNKNLTCPYCGYLNNGFSAFEDDYDPSEGDISICVKCTRISLFEKDLTLKTVTSKDEKLILKTNPEIHKLRKILSLQNYTAQEGVHEV
jgi:hypothetical protein